MRELDADNVPGLIDRVLGLGTELGDRPLLWFRGVSCDKYALTPKIMRGPVRSYEDLNEREARLLTRFRQRSLPYWPTGYPQTSWEHLFAMQHHGISTRLLDWSESLLLAAYFAASSSTGSSGGHPELHDGDCVPCVWVLDPRGWNRAVPQLYDSERGVLTTADEELRPWEPAEWTGSGRLTGPAKASFPVALYGTHNSLRITAQRGNFTVAGKEWRPLEDYCKENTQADQALVKVRLIAGPTASMRELTLLGVGESSVYPDLAGLARELDQMEGWA